MENTMRIPVICTRGIVVFPGQDVMIEVGRQKSVNAINTASDEYDGQVFIVYYKYVPMGTAQVEVHPVKKPETEDLPAGIREVRIRIIGKSRQVRQSLLEKWKDLDVSHISG